MPKLINTFTKGVMNKDIDPSLITQDTYIHAENIRFSTNDSNDGIGKNIKGTLQVSNSTDGSSDLKCISAIFDKNTDCIFYFLASTDGVISKIVEYNITNNQTTDVLHDDQSILKFIKGGYITGVDEINGLLLFSEWGNNPRRVNIERAKAYGKNGFTEEEIALMIKPPAQKLKITLRDSNTSIQKENNIEERMFAFSYRYRYLDGEYSSVAPFTNFAFAPKRFNYDFSTQSNKSMINRFNQVVLEFNTGSKLVTEIQLIFKQSDTLQGYIIDDFDKKLLNWGDNEQQTFVFDNLKSTRGLPKEILRNNSSKIPITSKSQALINGRLMLSNYLEDYNIKDKDRSEIEIDYTLEVVSEAVSITSPEPTVKSIRDYEVVIVYKDEWFRETTALSSKKNTIFVGNELSIKKNTIDVLLKNKPPYWAKYYQFFIRQNGKGYEQILPITFYEDGVFRWIKIESSDVDKIKEGDILYVKSDTRDILTDIVKVKVLEIKIQERNFLEDIAVTALKQVPGNYFKIKPEKFRIYQEDITFYEFKGYDDNDGANNVIGTNPNVVQAPVYYGTDGLNDLTSSGTYTGNSDERYKIEIDSIGTAAKGTVTLNSGSSGSIDSITINGVNVLSSVVNFNVDLPTTALNAASNINALTSTPNYNATASGNTITITAEELNSSYNGFIVTSTTTTITSTDVNLSGGISNTFKWSKDNGATFEATNVAITAGTAQELENGVEITFASNTGHKSDDSWFVGAKHWGTNYFGQNEDARIFAIFKGPDGDSISNGASINITYDETGDEKEYIEKSYISSANYYNLEEWFIQENIIDDLGVDADRIYFRRGTVENYPSYSQINVTTDGTGTMNLIIRGLGFEGSNADTTARVVSVLQISQISNPIIFETEPKDSLPEIFYEIGRTYEIKNNLHQADTVNSATDINQTTSLDARIKLDWFNAWSFGNGVESYKIYDEFNQKGLDEGIRVTSRTKEKYQQVLRETDITWSDVYNDDSNFNGLSAFNPSLLNWITLDKENGSIQKLHNSNGNLMVLQEEAAGLVPYNKNIIYDAQGGSVVGISTNILQRESYRPYAQGKVGISKNPESFVSVGSRNYFTDKQRGNLVRLSIDGVTEINAYGMEYEFSNLMIKNKTNLLIGGYDPKHSEYNLHLPSENGCLIFVEKAIGFTEYQTFEPDFMLSANNEFYSWKNGIMYQHNASETRNNFYGVQYESKLKFSVNHSFGSGKIFNALGIYSTHPWLAKLKTPSTAREIPKDSFDKQNEFWFSEIMGNTNDDIYNNSVFGLGSYPVSAGVININFIPDGMCVGDKIISKDITFIANEIIGVSGNTITLQNNVTHTSTFLMYAKNQNIDGASIKGNIMEVELISDETEKVEIRAVKTEAIRNINT